jgi:DNA mismatch repair protein MutS2
MPAAEKVGKKVKKEAAAPFYPSPGMELDLRGQRAEDALDALDRYLESAFLAGLLYVRIIHGKGTGRLRQVVREALTESPHVSRWENGQDKEGGEGVTVAHLHAP